MAFIGANPGGGKQSRKKDRKYGVLSAPYNKHRQYNAWLDDTHWKRKDLQKNVRKAFRILFGKKRGESVLRSAACFNVVPIRSKDVKELSQVTWDDGVDWCINVMEHVSPRVIVCLGNQKDDKSAWSAFAGKKDMNIHKFKRERVQGKFYLKRGYIARGKLKGTLLVGLPHLSRMKNMSKLREAGKRLKIRSVIRQHLAL